MNTLWCIERAFLDQLTGRTDWATLMADADPVQAEAMYEARAAGNPRQGSVAVLPVYGPLSKRDTMLGMLFGGTSYNRIIGQLNALAADDTVATILLAIDSPGGEAAGAQEAAAAIRRARETKPVVALANSTMGSAAAWLGWSASEVIATPDAMVGSQGVYGVHYDTSGAMEREGIKPTYIASSDAKVGGKPGLPLDDDTRGEMQAIVDEMNRLFVNDVAAGRGITPAQVRAEFGNGLVFHAREAKRRGMVDRVEIYSQAVARLAGVKVAGGARADFHVATVEGTDYVIDSETGNVMSEAPEDVAEIAALAAAADPTVDFDYWVFNS